MAQINTRLSPDDRTRFGEYAQSVGLDAAELARLLIVRELSVHRVLGLAREARETRLAKAAEQGKLTAHFHDPALVEQFDAHAKAHGLSRSAAARLVFLTELDERWLSNAISWSPKTKKFGR